MINLRELKLKNKKVCDCGYEFTANDMTALIKNTDYQFYGGRVEYYSIATCPKCNKEVVLLLEPYNNTYRVIDIGEYEKCDESTEKPYEKCEIVTEISDGKSETEKFICPKCNREFKSRAGLAVHAKTCGNK